MAAEIITNEVFKELPSQEPAQDLQQYTANATGQRNDSFYKIGGILYYSYEDIMKVLKGEVKSKGISFSK